MCYEGNTLALNTLLIHRYTWEQLRTGPDGGPSNLKYKGIIKMQKKKKKKIKKKSTRICRFDMKRGTNYSKRASVWSLLNIHISSE